MNGNSSKQVLLSVLGIAILVVAVVGVSFAFFSYTKTGSTTNTISTGEIYTYMNTGDTMTLENAMPVQTTPTQVIPDSAATVEEGQPKGTTGDIGVLSFTVTGKNQSDTAITYKVYLVPGAAESKPAGKTNLIDDEDIGLLMSSTATGGTAMTAITTATNVKALITENGGSSLSDGALLGTGTIPANTNADVTHSYTINMWVRGDRVKISDTDASVNGVTTKYCAKAKVEHPETTTATGNNGCQLNLPLWSSAYYMAKVRVVANTNATNTGVNYGA